MTERYNRQGGGPAAQPGAGADDTGEPLDLGPTGGPAPGAGAAGEGTGLTARAEQAVEEVVEEAERCIGHYPVSAVAAALGGGVLIGWLIGRAAGRR